MNQRLACVNCDRLICMYRLIITVNFSNSDIISTTRDAETVDQFMYLLQEMVDSFLKIAVHSMAMSTVYTQLA